VNDIAMVEYLGYLSEYKVETIGFFGPDLEFRKNDELQYLWKKRKDDSTLAELKVIVNPRRFSNTAVGPSGSQAYWST
jgi:hypothetical protein